MSNRDATYEIVTRQYKQFEALVIRDVGFHDRQLTVTNDADGVVRRLWEDGKIGRSTRLFYYDSEGKLDEIMIKWGNVGEGPFEHPEPSFSGFKHCPLDRHENLLCYVVYDSSWVADRTEGQE